eukprot:IDg14501t1
MSALSAFVPSAGGRLPTRARSRVRTCALVRMVAVKGTQANPYRVAVLAGDGEGPRVAAAACQVLDALAVCADLHFAYVEADYGARAFEHCGVLVPPETVDICRGADAVLRSYQGVARGVGRDGSAHFQLRDALGLSAQMRPVVVYPQLAAASPLRADLVEGVDLMLVREISAGALGAQALAEHSENSTVVSYTATEVERIADVAWELAGRRSGRLLNVDKADAMSVSRFWRASIRNRFATLASANSGIVYDDMYVDDFMRELILRPSDFDVVVTSNLFGDVLAEAMAALAGPQRVTPSYWVNNDGLGVYGPADIYNASAYPSPDDDATSPIALIRAASMMLRYAFDEPAAADLIQQALRKTMEDVATPGIPKAGSNGATLPTVEPEEYAEIVVGALELNRQYEQKDLYRRRKIESPLFYSEPFHKSKKIPVTASLPMLHTAAKHDDEEKVRVEIYCPVKPTPELPTSLQPPLLRALPPVIYHVQCSCLPASADAQTLGDFLAMHTGLRRSLLDELAAFGALYTRIGVRRAHERPGAPRVRTANTALTSGTQLYARIYASPKRHRARGALVVLYDAPPLLIVHKPPGLPVAASADNVIECVTALLQARVAHRLDIGTCGVLALARGGTGGAAAVNAALSSARKRYRVLTTARPSCGELRHWHNMRAPRGRGLVRERLLAPHAEF